MIKKTEKKFESNESVEKVSSGGFVPVQYKILKLDSDYILKSKKIEVPKAVGTGKDEYYQVEEEPLLNWLILTHGKNGLVSVGDNILFQKIREAKEELRKKNETEDSENGDKEEPTPNEQQYAAFEKLREYRNEIKKLKRICTENPTEDKLKELNQKIMDMETFLFIPEVINVQNDGKGDYNKFAKKGFYYGNQKFVRRSAGAGNLKQNTVTFIREDIAKIVVPKLRVGFQLDIETSAILAPSKFGAYEGLTTSGCIFVTTPNVVVIPDFEYITFKDKDNKEHCVYYVTKEQHEEEDKPIYHINTVPFFETKKDEEGKPCAYLNSFDGMGLASDTFVQRVWQKDLHIGYTPSAFIVRSIGVKGLLVTFPIQQFAKAYGFTHILDIRHKGKKPEEIQPSDWTDINEVDVILTESQWKYKKLYQDNSGKLGCNFDYYNGRNEAIWGVQRYAPEFDKDISRLNYQLTQTSNITKDEDVQRVVEPTEKYVSILANGEKEHIMYALLKETMRKKKEQENGVEDNYDSEEENSEIEIEEINETEVVTSSTDNDSEELQTSTLNRAIYKNYELLDDIYVSGQMQGMIKNILDKAKCGKLYPKHNSNYEFMISDPYGLAQWAFGWFEWMTYGTQGRENRVLTNIPKSMKEEMVSGIGLIPPKHIYSNYWLQKGVETVDACRSPMTDIAEHNILTVCNPQNTSAEIFKEMKDYYKWITSGIIYSLHDLSVLLHSDSDWDGDIVCTHDTSVFIENAWGVMPTTYDAAVTKLKDSGKEKEEEKPEKEYTIENAVKADLQGFGNKVGVYSNYSTSLFGMMPLFKDGDRHNDEMYPEYDCTEKQLELHKVAKKARYIIGEEIDSTKTGQKPVLSQDFIFTPPSKYDCLDLSQEKVDAYIARIQKQNELVPRYMPYFFIYAKPYYRDLYTKYKTAMNDTCKWYTFESIDNFVGAVMRGERELVTDDEKAFWEYFSSHCPLLLTDCLMNRICWKLETFENQINATIKEKWKTSDKKYVLMGYAKEKELTNKQKAFIREKYDDYKKEIMSIYNKKNVRETNDLFQASKRESLIFRIRRELCEELKVGFTDLFDMLVSALKSYREGGSLKSINAFLWNIMGDDILDVIPESEKYLEWDDQTADDDYDVEILGRKVKFVWRERSIDKK